MNGVRKLRPSLLAVLVAFAALAAMSGCPRTGGSEDHGLASSAGAGVSENAGGPVAKGTRTPRKAAAILIACGRPDERHYGRHFANIESYCESDVSQFKAILKRARIPLLSAAGLPGSGIAELEGKFATRSNVLTALRAGLSDPTLDELVIYYSGHGLYLPENVGPPNEEEGLHGFDSTWCLWDAQLVDDELDYLWHEVPPNRAKPLTILLVSDSCSSGSMQKANDELDRVQAERAKSDRPGLLPEVKTAKSADAAQEIYSRHRAFYDALFRSTSARTPPNVALVYMGACADGAVAFTAANPIDGSQFTARLASIAAALFDSSTSADYVRFHKLLGRLDFGQAPTLHAWGRLTHNDLNSQVVLLLEQR